MSGWALLPVVSATLYCFWSLLSFTFGLIDRRHDPLRKPSGAGVPRVK